MWQTQVGGTPTGDLTSFGKKKKFPWPFFSVAIAFHRNTRPIKTLIGHTGRSHGCGLKSPRRGGAAALQLRFTRLSAGLPLWTHPHEGWEERFLMWKSSPSTSFPSGKKTNKKQPLSNRHIYKCGSWLLCAGVMREVFVFMCALCPVCADNECVVSDHWRLHVICNASVQWSLFSVKSNYPHKKESLLVRALQKRPRSFSSKGESLLFVWTRPHLLSMSKKSLFRGLSSLLRDDKMLHTHKIIIIKKIGSAL